MHAQRYVLDPDCDICSIQCTRWFATGHWKGRFGTVVPVPRLPETSSSNVPNVAQLYPPLFGAIS